MKPTPGPWTVSTITGHRLRVVMAGPLVIADCRSVDSAEGNAEFIVRACNSHEELLEAAKKECQRAHGELSYEESIKAIKGLEQAIAHAERESK